MAVSEQQRHKLHSTLEAKIGAREAATLMEYLPPVGWADVARQPDINRLDQSIDRLDQKIDRLDQKIDGVQSSLKDEINIKVEALESRLTTKITRSQNRVVLAMMGTMLTTVIAVSGLAFAAAGLT